MTVDMCFAAAERTAGRGRSVRRRGVAAVEMAIVLPILILALVGIIEFGRAVMVQQIITNAAREGARRGVTPGVTTEFIRTRYVIPYVSRTLYGGTGQYPQNIGTSTVVVTVATEPSGSGLPTRRERITVRVTVPYDQVSYGMRIFMGGRTLSAQVTMRRELT